jgi:YHS domain-containing protein
MNKLLITAVLLATFATAAEKTLVNVDAGGLAIQGYDAVAFFTDARPVKGSPAYTATYKGARYWFASEAHKQAFDQEPAKFEPQFGGFCAYGASVGKAKPIKIEAWEIVNGRLLMQYDTDTRDGFDKDPQTRLKLADEKWPGVVDKLGK